MRSGLDDPQRIAAARRLLAEAGGEALDRLAALSARLLGAAYAQVALLTDTITPVTPIAPAQPRAEELIHQTADLGMPIVLSNARVDGVGAFLGVPVDVAGARVGVLCVYDREPTGWNDHDVEIVQELAATVATELEHRALAAELQSSTVRLDLGFAAADIGSFDWNLVTNALHWDDRLMELFGYESESYVPHIDSFSVRLHPDDRERTEAAIARAIDGCGDYEADYRVVHPDGSVRWVAARGRVLCDPDGRPTRMLGAAYDTSDVHSAAERLGRVLETMSTAFFTLDREYRFTYLNAEAERLLGPPPRRADRRGDLGGLRRPRGHRVRDQLPRRDGERRAAQLRALLPAAGRPLRRPRDAQRRRAERLLPRHLQPRPRRARARGGAGADRRGDRAPADPQRGQRAAGGHAGGRRAAADPRRRRAQRLRRRARRRARRARAGRVAQQRDQDRVRAARGRSPRCSSGWRTSR